MHDHLMSVVRSGVMYSIKRSALQTESLSEALREPRTQRAKRAAGLDADAGDAMEADVEVDGSAPSLDPSVPICFQVIQTNIGRKKTVPVAVGAGGKLEQTASVISVHPTLEVRRAGAELVVQALPTMSPGSDESAVILDQLAGSIDEIRDTAAEWCDRKAQWNLRGSSPVTGCSSADVREVITAMMAVGAYPGNHSTTGYSTTPQHAEVVEAMWADG
jgi:hypothetical protein